MLAVMCMSGLSWRLVIPKDKGEDIGSWTGLRSYRYPRQSVDDVRPFVERAICRFRAG